MIWLVCFWDWYGFNIGLGIYFSPNCVISYILQFTIPFNGTPKKDLHLKNYKNGHETEITVTVSQ